MDAKANKKTITELEKRVSDMEEAILAISAPQVIIIEL
jgi:hypothetical protein